MGDKPSRELIAAVLEVLTETEGKPLHDVHTAVGVGARPTIAGCLRFLCADGRARYIGLNGNRLYFRSSQAT